MTEIVSDLISNAQSLRWNNSTRYAVSDSI